MLLYLNSSPAADSTWKPEAFAFVPQLLFCIVLLPLVLAKRDLPSCLLAQTFAFVTFNKVCTSQVSKTRLLMFEDTKTSQYFLWYIAFLPFYLPRSSMLRDVRLGIAALVLWIAGQGIWLQQGYQLEFLGGSAFSGLWLASMIFFGINIWILGIVVVDVRQKMTKVD